MKRRITKLEKMLIESVEIGMDGKHYVEYDNPHRHKLIDVGFVGNRGYTMITSLPIPGFSRDESEYKYYYPLTEKGEKRYNFFRRLKYDK